MCGIFGLIARPGQTINRDFAESVTKQLFLLSESRGKEASGLSVAYRNKILVSKTTGPAHLFIKSKAFKDVFDQVFSGAESETLSGVSLIGHARLVTNGLETSSENNQPVVRDGVVCIHNGIIVNDAELWEEFPGLKRCFQVDTEIVVALLHHFLEQGFDVTEAMRAVFSRIKGAASVALQFEDRQVLALATNTGSLYVAVNESKSIFLFASEQHFLADVCAGAPLRSFGPFRISRIQPGNGLLVDINDLSLNEISDITSPIGDTIKTPVSGKKRFEITKMQAAASSLRRCSRCILPETMPGISFDNEGVCNFCRTYVSPQLKGHEALLKIVDKYRSKDGSPDCIVAFSGGRDSSYGLHFVKNVLKMNPIAYTYDWGMVTDIARRNTARMCGQLGVEHILRSADIKKKRRNIRLNINAWLKRPNLGVIPLFMAGDKQFYWYAKKLRQETGIKLVIFCAGNHLEKTNFKTGFTGIKEDARGGVVTMLPLKNKFRIAWYYLKQFLLNPRYFNWSIFDTLWAYYSTYMLKDDFIYLYHYIKWDEDLINKTLAGEYHWESAKDTQSTWRIGDGTAAFYNYIYYTIAGFSEYDTFRSNQIREGIITRDEALALIEKDNIPRLGAIQEYAQLVGFNSVEAMNVINTTEKLY